MFFGNRESVVAVVLVLHRHEGERAAASGFGTDIEDARHLGGGIADAQRLVEPQAAAGPHAARQRHRRQEAAAAGMAIGTDLGLPVQRQEIEPVPERCNGIAANGRRVIVVERRRECLDGKRRDLVLAFGRLPNPFFQLHNVHHVSLWSDCLASTMHGAAAASNSKVRNEPFASTESMGLSDTRMHCSEETDLRGTEVQRASGHDIC